MSNPKMDIQNEKTELRRDPVIGQWVIVHTQDSVEPDTFERQDQTPKHEQTCQFCPQREAQTPPEVAVIRQQGTHANKPGWKARVVSNKFPALKIEGDINKTTRGIFEMSNGVGAHEVVIENTSHDRNLADFSKQEVVDVLKLYQQRVVDLTKDRRFKYVMIFKNFGESAGTSVEHPHSQIIALPMIPEHVLAELRGVNDYYYKNQRCVFCDMLQQEKEDQQRIIMENDEFISFCPFTPRYEFETWIFPKNHDSKFANLNEGEQNSLASILKDALFRLKECLHNPSYNFYFHIDPVNCKKGDPEISGSFDPEQFHWHIEIVPSLKRSSGFEWGSGFYVVRTDPQKAAGYLRSVI